jgi:Zn-finger nucleic acid-binding protein
MICPNCSAQMTERALEGHLGTKVTIDLCEGCQAFWFDGRESLQLSPGATLQLFQTIGEQAAQTRQPSRDGLKCPRCDARMKIVSDLQRSTRFQYRQCPQRHGRFITFFDFLREKNFIRPLSRQQIDELRQHLPAVHCSNCGASVDLARGSMCGHCGSALSMLDLKQAGALVQQLRDADRGKDGVDAALPLHLSRARRDVEASFAAFERDQSWFEDVSSVGLVQAGLTAVNRWMKRSG